MLNLLVLLCILLCAPLWLNVFTTKEPEGFHKGLSSPDQILFAFMDPKNSISFKLSVLSVLMIFFQVLTIMCNARI
jgi:hypothetical protein